MNIKETIALINRMQPDGVIDRYAIGGAVGATFYLEPVATLDLDIFVAFRPEVGQLLISPRSIFDYLKARGGVIQGEYIVVAGWPVQFLRPVTPLVDEALQKSIDRDVEGTPTCVFTAEHLAAIALQTGRAKGLTRLLQFIEEGVLDNALFQDIIVRHGLRDLWQ